MMRAGRYEIGAVIGAGGMATVHLGRLRGPGGFSRVVAVKRLHAGFARDPEKVSMLLDEARLASRVRHPNVAAVLEVIEEGGEVLVVMEHVEGLSLSEIGRGAVPPAVAVAVACDVLEGLEAAHEARGAGGERLGVVHRDVSPQNVLVGSDGRARLVDFGIAKATGRLHVTRDGSVKGKLGYMAPEHVRGEPLSRGADVYAAAAVLWEMLAGVRLFDGENDAAVVVASLNGARTPPSVHAEGVGAELDAVVMRGLAARPRARWASARAMADALRGAAASASAGEVAAWLEARAGAELAARRDAARAMEMGAGLEGAGLEGAGLEGAGLEGAGAGAARAVGTRRGRRGAWGLAVGAGIGLVVAAVAGGVVASGREAPLSTSTPSGAMGDVVASDREAPLSTSTPPAASGAAAEGSVRAGPPSPPEPTNAATTMLLAPPAAPSAVGATSTTTAGSLSPASAPRSLRTHRAPTPTCDPPFTLQGHRKVWKPGCS